MVERIKSTDDFELLAPTPLTVICFRYHPRGVNDPAEIDRRNERLLEAVNRTGHVYITHTKLNGIYTLRLVIAQTNVTADDVNTAWQVIERTARTM